jgi:hypothetical protein
MSSQEFEQNPASAPHFPNQVHLSAGFTEIILSKLLYITYEKYNSQK